MIKRLEWLTPLAAFFTAYAFLSLDQIGVEFQNPFSTRVLGCLPLDEMCATIERNLLALLETKENAPHGPAGFDNSVHPVKGVTLAGWE
jgi:putative membrane protein